MLSDVAHAVGRRWYVVVVVATIFGGIGWTFTTDGGTYYTRTVVWFTTDAASTILPDNGSTNDNIIAFAGAVATELNRGRPPANYASAAAPYYGAGVREGVLVALRDVGGQWSSWYAAAVIELHIVGRTEQWVADQRDDLLAQIDEATRERAAVGTGVWAGADSAPSQRITVSVEPLTTDITYVSATRIQRLSAYGALAVGALLTGTLLVTWLDRIGLNRSRHRRPGRGAIRVPEKEALT